MSEEMPVMTTEAKFAAYEAANLAGGGEQSHSLWDLFTHAERELWKKQAGPLMPLPTGTKAPDSATE